MNNSDMEYYPSFELYDLEDKYPGMEDLLNHVLYDFRFYDENDPMAKPGFIRELPAAEWLSYPWQLVRIFMHFYPIYVLPTTELLDKLDELIGDYKAIEIGAGSGNIGRHLDIKMTDSYQQTLDRETQMVYKIMKQPTMHYPSSVFHADALTAVRRLRPECVIGCYVTHKFRDGMQEGNSKGVDFPRLLQSVKRLILVGNKHIHSANPIMALPHEEIYVEGLITRNEDRSADRIFVWDTDKLMNL